MERYDVAVIGAGPAGLAAACSAYENGARKIIVIDRDREAGGILNQCIHSGFGLHYFKEELTGPEYAGRFIRMLKNTGVRLLLDTMVLKITRDKQLHIMNPDGGYRIIDVDAVVLAMGCRERTRGAIGIPGTRPAGVFTAGTAQRYVNIEGYMVGKRVVILGSGDIGLIMARRMTLEGAKVLACIELMPYSNGLKRNIAQCLDDYDIPLYLSHTITEIRGCGRVEGVTVQKVGVDGKPVAGTEINFDCDTVLLSVGLIPENELSREARIEIDPRTGGPAVYENMETSVPGIFACGNSVHVHDLVDYVTLEAQRAGAAAAAFGKNPDFTCCGKSALRIDCGENIAYTVPQYIRPQGIDGHAELLLRVKRPFENGLLEVSDGGKVLCSFKRAHMAPGEMEKIIIPQEAIKSADGSLAVSVKGE